MSSSASSFSLNGQHHSNGDAPIFNEKRVTPLILEWQRTGNEQLFTEIIDGSLDLIRCLIRLSEAYSFDELDALTNDCVLKLHRALAHYRTNKGRSFSFIIKVLTRFLINRKNRICTHYRHSQSMPEEQLPPCPYQAPDSPQLLPVLRSLLPRLQTRFQEPLLIEIQRKMVHQILTYQGRRGHSYLPAWMKPLQAEYPQLPEKQMRLLYRYVLMQIRTLLYETYVPAPLPRPADGPLAQLWDQLGAEKFTKLIYIFGDLNRKLNVLRKQLPGLKNFY